MPIRGFFFHSFISFRELHSLSTLQVASLDSKLSKLSSLSRPVDDDILRYETSLELHEPFGIVLDDGKKVEKDVEKTLNCVNETYDKLDAVEKAASDVDEELEKYGIERTTVRSTVLHRRRTLDDIKEGYEKKKETVEKHVIQLEDFLDETDKLKAWTNEIKSEVDEIYFAEEEPENVEKQLNEVEVRGIIFS